MSTSAATTVPIPFEFICTKSTLRFTHDLPASILGSPSPADTTYTTRLVAALDPILSEHYEACLAASASTCSACAAAPTTKALQTPTSFLHIRDTPSVKVTVVPVCGDELCELGARKGMQELHEEAARREGGCEVCDRVEGVKKCSGCKEVGYCSRECQKRDWKIHKGACGARKSSMREAD